MSNGKKVAVGMLLSIFTLVLVLWPKSAIRETNVQGISSEPNVKIAFYGDSHDVTGYRNVLTLMKNENPDAVVGVGDYDYSTPPDVNNYENIFNGTFGANFPLFWAVGNHEVDEGGNYWPTTCSNGSNGCYASNFLARMQRIGGHPGITATTLNDQMYSTTFQGVKLVFVGDSKNNSKGDSLFAPYIESQLRDDNHKWKICIWHRNQNAMQLGGKGNDMGWGVYEKCRQYGAIVITAHEHSYARTKTLSNIQTQTVDSTYSERNVLRVEPGKTFVVVTALGGQTVDRAQTRCTPTTYPYGCKGEWAFIYTTSQNAVHGAMFLEFNVNGDPNKAKGYFKNTNGVVVDSFDITTTGASGGSSISSTVSSTSTQSSSTVSSTISSSTVSSTSSRSSSRSTTAACKGDYNANGMVDITDFSTFATNYKKSGINCNLDITGGNCFLDVADFAAFASVYKVANVCAL